MFVTITTVTVTPLPVEIDPTTGEPVPGQIPYETSTARLLVSAASIAKVEDVVCPPCPEGEVCHSCPEIKARVTFTDASQLDVAETLDEMAILLA